VSIAIKEGLVENGGGINGCKGHALRITARGRAIIGSMQEAA
jgi:hypothetical protein